MGERLYTQTHEWVEVDGETVRVGISDYAQAQLGDVVFLELPRPGQRLEAGDSFGSIESVKAASDLYAPLAGTVVEVNERLAQNPELVNTDPYGEGWLLRLRPADQPSPGLLDEAGYKAMTEGQHH